MLTAWRLTIILGVLLLSYGSCFAADHLRPVVDEIRYEATLPTTNDLGYPLPLLASWSTGEFKGGFHPLRQLQLIEQGHYLLPWFYLPPPGKRINMIYYKKAIEKFAELNLPISFISTQWESLLTGDSRYFNLPSSRNPNVVTVKGDILKKVSPFGPVKLWEDVGREWTANSLVKRLQNWYPDPPLVLFISNNEHTKLKWTEAGISKRFVSRYGANADDEAKRRAFGDGWIQRYRALQAGMRDGLSETAWRNKARFIGYNAWGLSALGRWDGWQKFSANIPGRISPMPLAWDGASASYYLNDWEPTTDFTVWSPQIEAMNWVFMQKEAYRLNPNFWFELSVWDGHANDPKKDKREHLAQFGQAYTPQRYAAYVKFGMWLLRPRVVRDFRYKDEYRKFEPYVMALANAVDQIHGNDVLRRFWRRGRLVKNMTIKHPYQASIPNEYKDTPRWFLLNTSRDAPRPWRLGTKIPVFTLALVYGSAPQREWLVYGFSPQGDEKGVTASLPGYGDMTVDITKAGDYFLVKEVDKSVNRLSMVSTKKTHALFSSVKTSG